MQLMKATVWKPGELTYKFYRNFYYYTHLAQLVVIFSSFEYFFIIDQIILSDLVNFQEQPCFYLSSFHT